MDRERSISWPLRSPDLSPLEVFVVVARGQRHVSSKLCACWSILFWRHESLLRSIARRQLPHSVTCGLLFCNFSLFAISTQNFTRNSIIYERACLEVLCEIL